MGFLATAGLALVLVGASGPATAEGAPDATGPPVVDGKPVEVAISPGSRRATSRSTSAAISS
jgi:hypothetical protein